MAAVGRKAITSTRHPRALSCFDPIAKATARAIYLETVAMVGEPMRERCVHPLALEDLAPLAEGVYAGSGPLVGFQEPLQDRLDLHTEPTGTDPGAIARRIRLYPLSRSVSPKAARSGPVLRATARSPGRSRML